MSVLSPRQAAMLLAIGLAAAGVLADYFLKLASEHPASARSPWFWIGLGVYAAMAGGWVVVMRQLSFTEIGIVYSVATILLLTAVGTLVLGETLRPHEIAGVALALGSLVLLARFA